METTAQTYQARELIQYHYQDVHDTIMRAIELNVKVPVLISSLVSTKHHYNKCRSFFSIAYPERHDFQYTSLKQDQKSKNERIIELEYYKMQIKMNDTRSKQLRTIVKRIIAELKKRGEIVEDESVSNEA